MKRKATSNMITFASVIARTLELSPPDYKSFEHTSFFINENVERFNELSENIKSKLVVLTNYGTRGKFLDKASNDFLEFMDNFPSDNVYGLYFFWNCKKLVYVGKSVNLHSRLFDSLGEKLQKHKITHVSYMITETKADLHFLEPLIISEEKPTANIEFQCSDKSKLVKLSDLNIDIKAIDRVKVFRKGVKL